MPRNCTICSDPAKLRRATELIADGVADSTAADALGVGRMSVRRHRIGHVLAPAQALASAASRGREVAEQRAQVLAAAEAGTASPADYLTLAGIVGRLREVDERLERVGAAAEHDGQRIAVASLAGQQVRVVETRAKLGGVGAYAPARTTGDGAAGTKFEVRIIFPNAGRSETISTIDGQLAPEPDELEGPEASE